MCYEDHACKAADVLWLRHRYGYYSSTLSVSTQLFVTFSSTTINTGGLQMHCTASMQRCEAGIDLTFQAYPANI